MGMVTSFGKEPIMGAIDAEDRAEREADWQRQWDQLTADTEASKALYDGSKDGSLKKRRAREQFDEQSKRRRRLEKQANLLWPDD
jgi:hypothetical protein